MRDEELEALVAWEAAINAELAACTKEVEATNALNIVKQARQELTAKAAIALAKYELAKRS